MKSNREQAERLATLLRKLRREYGTPAPMSPLNPVERIVHSFLLWECRRDKADAAFAKVVERVVDFNELRVFLVDEIVQIIGERYPLARERCDRLRRVLNDIYRREFCVNLDDVLARGVRYADSHISELDGMVPYVSGQLLLLNCNGHAIPVDNLLREKLVKRRIVHKENTVAETRAWLEKHIRAAGCLEAHLLFQQWVEFDSTQAPRRSRKSGRAGDAQAENRDSEASVSKKSSRKGEGTVYSDDSEGDSGRQASS